MTTDRDLDPEILRRLLTYLFFVLDGNDTMLSLHKPTPVEVDALIMWVNAAEETQEPANAAE